MKACTLMLNQKFTPLPYFYNYYFLLQSEIREDIPWSPGGCRSLYCTQDGGMIPLDDPKHNTSLSQKVLELSAGSAVCARAIFTL